ncbi:20112_t:CDS:2, partial [Racocetra persica]
SGSTNKVENMIQDLTNSFKILSLNLIQQINKKEAYTVESSYNPTNQNQERNRKIVQTEVEILEEDPDQDLKIIEEIHLEVKKDTEKILKIIINMIETNLEIIINMIEAGLEVSLETGKSNTLLNNTSIREALANYLQGNSNIVNLVHSNRLRTIPVKCQTTIHNKLFTAIIDSRATISMITQQAAKEIRLEIDTSSNSLILFTLGKQIRPLGVIKNISVEIARITISS